jgi:phosphate transport system ATP-binding protein
MPGAAQQQHLVDFAVHVDPAARHDRSHNAKVRVEHLSFWYGEKQALDDVSIELSDREVTALIGPSGCGKTTLLRCLNRTAELVPETRMEGRVFLDGADTNAPDVELEFLRRRFGWVAQKPNPFPKSIYANVAYGPRIHGLVAGRSDTDALVQACLTRVGLWDEVKDRLASSATVLSGGQQQRLCIARAISINPDVLLMDEPASALDPRATAVIEELINQLRNDYCVVIVTHNMQQAARISQRTAYFHLGRLIEVADAADMFMRPKTDLARNYITGRFG